MAKRRPQRGQKFTQKMQQDSPGTVLDRMRNAKKYFREGAPGSGIGRGQLSLTSSATPVIDADVYQFVSITDLAVNIVSITVTGTLQWRDGRALEISIRDNGSPRTITWGSAFTGGFVGLPTTTTPGSTLTVRLAYEEATGKWACQSAILTPA